MTEKTEALRLAEQLEAIGLHGPVAAELRRLSIENEALGLHLSERMKDLARVEAQRDALLEALRAIVHAATVHACHHALSVDGQQFYDIARAAIKAVEEEA